MRVPGVCDAGPLAERALLALCVWHQRRRVVGDAVTGIERSKCRERGILMTPDNAQKCHLGVKTQTRRIVKFEDSGRVRRVGSYKNWHIDDPDAIGACPYGDKGDRLWVREAWRVTGGKEYHYQQRIEDVHYKGDINELIEFGPAKWNF